MLCLNKYHIVLNNIDDNIPILWSSGESVSVVIHDQAQTFKLCVAGLISDGSLVDISGEFLIELQSDVDILDVMTNLHANYETLVVDIISQTVSLSATISLADSLYIDAIHSSHMIIARDVGAQSIIAESTTNSAILSAVILAVVADWSEETIRDLSALSMRDMAYTEVG